MAQAAKHLRKNKDLEAQLEQERKEKEEERNKKRSRSRDKKRKAHAVHRWLIDQDSSVSSEMPDGQGVWHYDDEYRLREKDWRSDGSPSPVCLTGS